MMPNQNSEIHKATKAARQLLFRAADAAGSRAYDMLGSEVHQSILSSLLRQAIKYGGGKIRCCSHLNSGGPQPCGLIVAWGKIYCLDCMSKISGKQIVETDVQDGLCEGCGNPTKRFHSCSLQNGPVVFIAELCPSCLNRARGEMTS